MKPRESFEPSNKTANNAPNPNPKGRKSLGWEFGEVAGGARGPTGCQRFLAPRLESLVKGFGLFTQSLNPKP